MDRTNITTLINSVEKKTNIFGFIKKLKKLKNDCYQLIEKIENENEDEKKENLKKLVKKLEEFNKIKKHIEGVKKENQYPNTTKDLFDYYRKGKKDIKRYLKDIDKIIQNLKTYSEKAKELGIEDDLLEFSNYDIKPTHATATDTTATHATATDTTATHATATDTTARGRTGGGKEKEEENMIEKDLKLIENIKKIISELKDISIISKRIVNFHNEYTELKNREDENIVDYLFGLVKIPQYNEDYTSLDKIFHDNKFEKNKNYRYLNNNGDGRSLEKYNKIIDEILKEYDIFKKERKDKIQNLKLDEIENRLIKEYYDSTTKRVMQDKFKKIKDNFLKKEETNEKIIDAFLKKLKENIKGDFDIFNNKLKSYESEKERNAKNQNIQAVDENQRKYQEQKIKTDLKTELESLNNQIKHKININELDRITEYSNFMKKYNEYKIEIVEKIEQEYLKQINEENKSKKDKDDPQQKITDKKEDIILELKEFIDNLYSNVKKGENLVNEYGKNVNIKAVPDIYQDLYNKFIEEKNNIPQDNSEESVKKMNNLYDKFLKEAEVYGLNQKEAIEINTTDKFLFILVVIILKTLSLSIIEYLIETDYIETITSAIAVYGVIYIILYVLIVLIINNYGIKMKLFFGYFNTDINTTLIMLHIALVITFIIIVYILGFNFNVIKINSDENNENEKIQLSYRIEMITNIILIFTILFVFLL
jgi:hypothetical protein